MSEEESVEKSRIMKRNAHSRTDKRRKKMRGSLIESLAKHWECSPAEAKRLARRQGIPGFAS